MLLGYKTLIHVHIPNEPLFIENISGKFELNIVVKYIP